MFPLTHNTHDLGLNAFKVRTGYFSTRVVVTNLVAGDLPTAINGNVALQIANAGPIVEFDSFGSYTQLLARRANGGAAAASQTKILANEAIVTLGGMAHDGAAMSPQRVAVLLRAAEDWAPGAHGTQIDFQTTTKGTASPQNRWALSDAGHFTPLAANGYDLGTDATKVRNGYYGGLVTVGVANPPPPIDTNTGLTISRNGVPRIEMNGGGSAPVLFGRRAVGSLSAPGATAANGSLLSLQAGGHDGTNWVNVARGAVNIVAAEVWTPGAQGTRIQFQTTLAGGVAALSERWTIQDDGHFYPGIHNTYDIGAEALAVRDGYFASNLKVIAAAPGLQPPPAVVPTATSAQLRVVGATGSSATLEMTAYAATPKLLGRRANTSTANPSASFSGDPLLQIEGWGYGGTGWSTGPRASITFQAASTWTDLSQSTNMNFVTTLDGTIVPTNRWQISHGGNFLPFGSNLYDVGTTGNRVRNFVGSTADLNVGLDVNSTGGTLPGKTVTTTLRLGAATSPVFEALLFGNAGANYYMGRRARGAVDNLQAILSGDNLVRLDGRGYGGSTWSGGRAVISLDAAQDWTETNQGTAITFLTTPLNGGSTVTRWTIMSTGDLVPAANNVHDIGSAAYRVREVFGVAAEFTGNIEGLRVNARSTTGGIGYAGLSTGTTAISGYVDFYAAAGPRVGYIGYADVATKLINISADTGYSYRFNTGVAIAGEIDFRVAGATADDKVEPRGRYWSRPAPSVSYPLALIHIGTLMTINAAADCVVTIPLQADVAWPNWCRIDFLWYGVGQVSFVGVAGVTIRSSGGKLKIASRYSTASLVQINPNEWLLTGDLAA
jgi:hypothetical protein